VVDSRPGPPLSTTLPDGLTLPPDCPVPGPLAPPPPIPRSAWTLAALALAIRAAAAGLDPVPPRDGIALATTVKALAEGSGTALLEAAHAPLPAALAAPLAAAGLDPLAALAAVAVLAGAAAVLPLFLLARRAFGADAAHGAALLYAVTPPLVRLGSTALGEPCLHLLALLSLDASLRALRHWRPARDAALAGCAAGAALLARPEALALLPPLLLAPLLPGSARPWRSRLLGATAGLACAALVAGPWMAAVAGRTGRWAVVPGKSVAVLAGVAGPADPGGAAPAERHGPAAAALQAAGAIPEAIHPWPALLALLGLAGLLRKERCGKVLGPPLLLLFTAGLFLGGVALLEWRYGYGGRRHASTAGLLLLPFAGEGLLAAAALLGRAGGPLRKPAVALGLLALGGSAALAAGALLQRDRSGAAARELGIRLRGSGPAGQPLTVATFGEPRIAWYAGGVDVRLLREFGVRPGTAPADAARMADGLRWHLRGRFGAAIVAIEEGDPRVPPGFPGAGAPGPLAAAGRLRAWRTLDLPVPPPPPR
jgi:hypothetical protein